MAQKKNGGGGGNNKPVAVVKTTSNSNNPAANTRTVTPINGATQQQANAAANKSAGTSQAGVKINGTSVGSNLSRNEALQIAQETGKSVAQVMAKAVEKGMGLTAGLVNNFNSGNLGPNFQSTGFVNQPGLASVQRGTNAGAMQALEALRGVQGLQLQQGQLYTGYSTTTTPGQGGNSPSSGSWHTPGSTTYNPIVVSKGYTQAAPRPAAAPAAAAPATGPVANWENSVNNSNQELIDSINAQIEANRAQADLYMGQINNLMSSMQQASQGGGLQSITPYATTTTVTPATGAQMTQAITARKKPTDTDLSISPFVADLAGTGLNIAI